MTELINRYKNVLAGMLLLILSVHYVNSSMFYHQHVVSGETIFHSHIFSKAHTSSEDGGHSLDMIKLIAVLSNINVEQQNFESHIQPLEAEIEPTALIRPTAQATFYLARSRSLRAPPVYNLI